jgi:hypothetical protein
VFCPGSRVRFGFLAGFANHHDAATGRLVTVADPRHPVRAARFAVNLIRCRPGSFGHVWPKIYHLHCVGLNHPIESSFWRVSYVTLTCPNCGNDRNFLVKTLQMHVVHLEDGSRVEVSEESRPAVLEVLCDECESALNFEEFEDTLRKEVLLTIGAR